MRNYEKPSMTAVKLTADIICTSPELLKVDANGMTVENAEKIVFA